MPELKVRIYDGNIDAPGVMVSRFFILSSETESEAKDLLGYYNINNPDIYIEAVPEKESHAPC